MSKLGCTCGHIIIDRAMNLPYKANILPDQHVGQYYDSLEPLIEALVAATKQGRRQQWIHETFSKEYPQDLTDAQMIGDIADRYYADLQRDVLQCEQCGRLWIQLGRSNQYTSFLPESPKGRNILAGTDAE